MAKRILISGCSSGIGLETARILAGKGYRVLATARKPADVQRLQAMGMESHPLDLDSSESIAALLSWIKTEWGGQLDVVFHNGAYGQPGALEDLSRQALQAQFETNLFGWHELNNAVLPLMRNQRRGRIIFNSSVLGLVCMPYRGAYNASKFALEAYADTLRLELRNSGIDVVLIEPGPIRSSFRRNAFAAFERHVNRTNSVHQHSYQQMAKRLQQPGDSSRFTLGAEAVAAKVLKAVAAGRPKRRYYVTLPTYLFAYLKRILPVAVLDELLRRG